MSGSMCSTISLVQVQFDLTGPGMFSRISMVQVVGTVGFHSSRYGRISLVQVGSHCSGFVVR